MLRTIIADDHPVVLMGARAALEAGGDIEVVGEATDGDQLLALLSMRPCDVVTGLERGARPHEHDRMIVGDDRA